MIATDSQIKKGTGRDIRDVKNGKLGKNKMWEGVRSMKEGVRSIKVRVRNTKD